MGKIVEERARLRRERTAGELLLEEGTAAGSQGDSCW